MFNKSKKEFRKFDKLLVFSFFCLVVFGLFVLNSAIGPTRANIKSQIFSTIIGLLALVFMMFIDLDFLKKIKWLIYIAIVGMLLATLLFGFGFDTWGGKSWLKIGPINIQPSEISKVGLIIFLAAYIDANKSKVNTLVFFIKYMILALFPVILIMRQPDFGTSMVYLFIIAVMLFMGGFSWKNIGIAILALVLILALTIPIIWSRLDDYQKDRLLDFKHTQRNLSSSGYQTEQGIIALGSGQFSGKGYRQGPFSQNRYIPESHTDFIFPVLVEELGFLGGAVSLGLFFTLLARILKVALASSKIYHLTLAGGIFALLFIHIFENVAMTMRIMPVTGIPLPFFSHGGSFQILNIICIAIVLSINLERKALDF